MFTIIRNSGTTLSRATLLKYLERKRYPKLEKKIRSIGE